MRGVNLGNWLVLEKWMSPGLFAGTDAEDETTLCRRLDDATKRERYALHRDSFITDRDIAYLANHGFELLRLPVPLVDLRGVRGVERDPQEDEFAVHVVGACQLLGAVQPGAGRAGLARAGTDPRALGDRRTRRSPGRRGHQRHGLADARTPGDAGASRARRAGRRGARTIARGGARPSPGRDADAIAVRAQALQALRRTATPDRRCFGVSP